MRKRIADKEALQKLSKADLEEWRKKARQLDAIIALQTHNETRGLFSAKAFREFEKTGNRLVKELLALEGKSRREY
jgi:hypothetical protein